MWQPHASSECRHDGAGAEQDVAASVPVHQAIHDLEWQRMVLLHCFVGPLQRKCRKARQMDLEARTPINADVQLPIAGWESIRSLSAVHSVLPFLGQLQPLVLGS